MTVLGNIVAVTSIIAVVSLIQGLNASVTAGDPQPGGRRLVQHPAVPGDAQRRGVREGPQQPAHHAAATRARSSRYGGDSDRRGHGRHRGPRPGHLSRQVDRQHAAFRASPREYVNFSSFDAERGRLMSPTEVDTSRPVAVLGWQTADRLFGDDDRSASTRSSRSRACTSASSASARRSGSVLGQSQDEFAIIPLGQFQMIFGSRRSLSLTVKPRDVVEHQRRRWTRRRSRCARRARPQAEAAGQLRHVHVRHDPRHLPLGDQRHLRGAGRRRRAVARRRRHRHHEHHADGGHRADARDRAAQGARRAAADIMAQMLTESVVLSMFGGVIGTMFGAAIATGHLDVHADPGGGRSRGRWRSASASPRWSACSSVCIRPCARRASIRSRRCRRE